MSHGKFFKTKTLTLASIINRATDFICISSGVWPMSSDYSRMQSRLPPSIWLPFLHFTFLFVISFIPKQKGLNYLHMLKDGENVPSK